MNLFILYFINIIFRNYEYILNTYNLFLIYIIITHTLYIEVYSCEICSLISNDLKILEILIYKILNYIEIQVIYYLNSNLLL